MSEGANFVTSAYGREGFYDHIKNILQNDALIYANKNKTLRLFSGSELELLTRLNNLGFDKIIHPSRNIVKTENKNSFSFSSPKTDTAPIGAEDFDVQPKNKVNPELEKALSDHDFVKGADGAVRTLAEYRAEKDAADVKKDAPVATNKIRVEPVQLEVKEFKNQDNKLYLSVCLKNKMEAGRLAEDADKVGLTSAAPTASSISIYKILRNVNPEYGVFLKYFPNDMLSKAQLRAKNNALFKEFDRIEKLFWAAKASFARRTKKLRYTINIGALLFKNLKLFCRRTVLPSRC